MDILKGKWGERIQGDTEKFTGVPQEDMAVAGEKAERKLDDFLNRLGLRRHRVALAHVVHTEKLF